MHIYLHSSMHVCNLVKSLVHLLCGRLPKWVTFAASLSLSWCWTYNGDKIGAEFKTI